ncbi:uncharacterized protein LOC103505277 [Diaphorina citri]|uniref:Uncharacterized protein LOC103505277 n=1 Tax=Diaphorina citri TaxID=121845 RepID=A0A1S4E6L2_DIACI|nr:uncharacterized protein LOC103505277 [Diaphorina citri]
MTISRLSLDTKSYTGKIRLLESQLTSLETVLQDSSQHCQQLTEENLEYAQQLIQLRSQVLFYQKLFEKNSLLTAVEKCGQLEEENATRVTELNAYVDKYRGQLKSWTEEWQKMSARFERKLAHYREENEALKRENSALRNYSHTVKCKIKPDDVT